MDVRARMTAFTNQSGTRSHGSLAGSLLSAKHTLDVAPGVWWKSTLADFQTETLPEIG